MPACGHKGATCVIGDFWTCKQAGCKNGPPKQGKELWVELEMERLARQLYRKQRDLILYGHGEPVEWDDGQKTPVVRPADEEELGLF